MSEHKPKFMAYEDWLKAFGKELKKTLPEEEWPCERCYGEGEHTCDCGHTHDCRECGGTGEKFYEVYKKQKEAEEKKWREWHNSKLTELISKEGAA